MTTIKVDKITPGSGTTTTLGDSGDTFTIPAGVTFTNSGSTNMGDQLTYCTTTKSASFTTVANKGYFINTSDASPFLNYAVTVASGTLYSVGGTGNAYFLDGSRNMALTLLKGRTYRFTQSDNTNDSHPLIISTSNSTTLSTFIAGIVSSGVSYYLDGASTQSNYINTTPFNAATTRYIEFQPAETGTFYFGCYIHGVQMGGAITSQELTVTLPSSPAVGTEMLIIDSTGDASTNNIVVGRGGSKIKGICNDATLKTDRVGVRLIYSDANQGWVTITSANETAPALNQTLYVTASGGTETTSGDYKIHTFLSDANFVVSSGGNANGSNTVDYLVVAGGGGGGHDNGAGAGAGGFRLSNSTSMPAPLTSPLATPTALPVSATTYPISIGAGGSGGTGPTGGCNGSNSTFSTIVSAGGGRGGTQGSAGGSGGGNCSTSPSTKGAGNTPPVSPPQGNPGGLRPGGAPGYAGGGGGGAGAEGDNSTAPKGGNGGIGSYVLNTGFAGSNGTTGPVSDARYFSGGGGGGGQPYSPGNSGTGGSGGGGNAHPTVAGGTNTGGGGGGGTSPSTGGTGGSGIVIIRYKYQN